MFGDSDGLPVFLAVFVSSLLKHIALGVLSARKRRLERCGLLSRITVYPVKSMKGVDVGEAECDYAGLAGHVNGTLLKDRVWMVVTPAGNFLTARQKPKLVVVSPSLHGDLLHLDAPGMETLKIPAGMEKTDGEVLHASVWGQAVQGIDCGDEAAHWISAYLEVPELRILFHADSLGNRRIRDVQRKWHQSAKDVDEVGYQDGFPFLMLSESSVKDLNRRLTDPVTTDNFRANLVVSTHFPPFSEDDWLEISIGGATFRNIKPCERCQMITVDPSTGNMHAEKEPLMTLRSYRLTVPEFGQAPCFGINLVLERAGPVRVGDAVYVTRRSGGWTDHRQDVNVPE